MATTAGDQINRALRLLGVLAEGEVPSAETANDALLALNQMIDSWSTERLAVYATQDQVFIWPAGHMTRTLGPTGDFVGLRPVQLQDSTYFISNGVSYSVQFVNQEVFDNIPVKNIYTSYPQLIFANNTFPNTTISVYPIPSQDLEWHFVSVQELAQPALLSTEMYFPPGYMRAFTYNLACEIAPEFGVEPSQQVQRIAMTSKRNLKRINNPGDVLFVPYALVANRSRFNIYTGYPQ
jgi:hypothetical protein